MHDFSLESMNSSALMSTSGVTSFNLYMQKIFIYRSPDVVIFNSFISPSELDEDLHVIEIKVNFDLKMKKKIKTFVIKLLITVSSAIEKYFVIHLSDHNIL